MKRLFLALIFSLGLFAQSPTVPPQPQSATYAINALEEFQTYTRASYLAATGTQAPAFDITKPAKSWYDTTVTGTATYLVYNGSLTQPALVNLTMPSTQAAVVNLPGLPTFPPYVQAVSNIQIVGPNGTFSSNYGGVYQSTFAQAQALMNEIGDSGLVISTGTGPMAPGSAFAYVKIDSSNPVSIYLLNNQNVGLMLQQRNMNGVGFPGTWAKNSTGNYVFAPAVLNDGSTSTLGSVPVPVRGLLPNETLVSVVNGLIPTPEVQRTDMTPTTTVPGGGLSAADEATLNHILKILMTVFPGN